MTPREKKLAALTGIMVLMLCGFFVWNQVSTQLKQRHNAITSLDLEIAGKQLILKKGRQATTRLAEYEQRSLPADREVARSIYQDWLLDLAKQVNLEEANVKAPGDYTNEGVFYRLTFNVSGIGHLDQIVAMIQRIYEFDHLHLIRRLTIVPIKDGRKLELAFSIEAAVLPGSVNQGQLTTLMNPWLANGDSHNLIEKITSRNIFAPPNHPPQLAHIGSKQVEVQRTLSFTAKAIDADPLDTVTYQLSTTAPSGARIGATSGKFNWTPTEIGEFEFDVVANDDNLPGKSVRQTVQVTVVIAPLTKVVTKPANDRPGKLEPDVAKHTYLIGTIERSGHREIWLQVRTTGKIHKLSEDDSIRFGSIDGKVSRIGNRDAEITVGDQRILVRVGENLSEADKRPIGGI